MQQAKRVFNLITMAAGNGKKKSKVSFSISTGMVDKGGQAVEIKMASSWNPGNTKGKKRSGKGHGRGR